MMTLDTLERWLTGVSENEHLEFKEAKQQYDTTKLMRYCVALANEGGGHLVLGVTDKIPRRVVGTHAFQNRGDITARILETLRIRVEVQELSKADRIRACYQHCALKYVSNERMSNQSLRERFKLPESKAATTSQVIGATKEAGLIKADESDTTSTRYARYLPFWA